MKSNDNETTRQPCTIAHRRPRRLAAMLACVIMSGSLAAAIAPDALIRDTTREVIGIVSADPALRSGDAVRTLALIEEKVLPHFDFQKMTLLALGRYWHRADEAQRSALVSGFRQLLVRTYSGALSQCVGRTVEVAAPTDRAGDIVRVKTRVTAPDAPPVALDYMMYRTADGWKVYDVSVEGVSLVTTYRSSFAAEVERGGIDGLIEALALKNSQAPPGARSARADVRG
ncbi:MAG: phospholipid-binding protein MlaC [Gammaproteobacteria bacterium]